VFLLPLPHSTKESKKNRGKIITTRHVASPHGLPGKGKNYDRTTSFWSGRCPAEKFGRCKELERGKLVRRQIRPWLTGETCRGHKKRGKKLEKGSPGKASGVAPVVRGRGYQL